MQGAPLVIQVRRLLGLVGPNSPGAIGTIRIVRGIIRPGYRVVRFIRSCLLMYVQRLGPHSIFKILCSA